MTLVWKDYKCTSITQTDTGHKLTVEWVNDNRWVWFVQDGTGYITDSFRKYNEPPFPRDQAKQRAYNAYLRIIRQQR